MEETTQEKEQFRGSAKELVDTLFDNDLLHNDLSRDDMNCIEDVICMRMQSAFDCKVFFDKINTKTNSTKED